MKKALVEGFFFVKTLRVELQICRCCGLRRLGGACRFALQFFGLLFLLLQFTLALFKLVIGFRHSALSVVGDVVHHTLYVLAVSAFCIQPCYLCVGEGWLVCSFYVQQGR